MRFAFDMDGTLTAHPVVLGAMMRALRAAGHEVFILTATGTDSGRRAQAESLGLSGAFDELIVCPGPTFEEAGPQKGDACRARRIDLMVDDQPYYLANCMQAGAVGLQVLSCG